MLDQVTFSWGCDRRRNSHGDQQEYDGNGAVEERHCEDCLLDVRERNFGYSAKSVVKSWVVYAFRGKGWRASLEEERSRASDIYTIVLSAR